jgi:hypothetical protein
MDKILRKGAGFVFERRLRGVLDVGNRGPDSSPALECLIPRRFLNREPKTAYRLPSPQVDGHSEVGHPSFCMKHGVTWTELDLQANRDARR